jgi:hypothetical protein
VRISTFTACTRHHRRCGRHHRPSRRKTSAGYSAGSIVRPSPDSVPLGPLIVNCCSAGGKKRRSWRSRKGAAGKRRRSWRWRTGAAVRWKNSQNSSYRCCRPVANRCPYSCTHCRPRWHTCCRLPSYRRLRCFRRRHSPRRPFRLKTSARTLLFPGPSCNAASRRFGRSSKPRNYPRSCTHWSLALWRQTRPCMDCRRFQQPRSRMLWKLKPCGWKFPCTGYTRQIV